MKGLTKILAFDTNHWKVGDTVKFKRRNDDTWRFGLIELLDLRRMEISSVNEVGQNDVVTFIISLDNCDDVVLIDPTTGHEKDGC